MNGHIDILARQEGEAIKRLNTHRRKAEILLYGHSRVVHDSMLWNKNQHRLDVQRAEIRENVAKRIVLILSKPVFTRKQRQAAKRK